MPFNFNAFAGGLGQGYLQGQKLRQASEESALKAKMLKLQANKLETEQAETQQQNQALGRFVEMLGSNVPQPAPLQPGQEGPTIPPGISLPNQQATQQELFGQALKSIPAAHRYNLIQQQMKPQGSALTRPVKPGDYVPDPTAPGGYRQIGVPNAQAKEPTKRQLTEAEIGQLHPELPAERRKVIASLPVDSQERTLDNLRATQGQQQAQSQFESSQARLQSQFQQGLTARDVAEQRREEATVKKQEAGLRAEHQKQSKNFITQRDNFNTLEAASGGRAIDDHALIFAYLKVLDPQSTVREGEFATVENARGVPDSVRNLGNKVLKGTRLTPSQRQQILNQASAQFEASRRTQEGIDSQYRQLAAGQGLDPNRVVLDYTTPSKKSGSITAEAATAILKEAGGDKNKAREIARQRGYKF